MTEDGLGSGSEDQTTRAERHRRLLGPVRINSITIQTGDPIALPAPGVTAIVGGNNVGKSTILKQMHQMVSRDPYSGGFALTGPQVLQSLDFSRETDADGLNTWLEQHAANSSTPRGSSFTRPEAGSIDKSATNIYWHEVGLGPLASFLVHYAPAEQRFNWTVPTPRRSLSTDPPAHPLHALEDDIEAFSQLSDLSERMFGTPLTLDPLSGNLAIRSGRPDVVAPPVDRITTDYRSAINALPLLADQGDGMRSALGMLIPLIAAAYPVVLIDEPEAFLHPPQARLLGQALAELAAERGIQVVIATHDRNILAGLLDAKDIDIAVVRLSREGKTTTSRLLAPDDLRTIWTTPALKFTNILDGLFHQLVVLAENEIDCRFYAAAIEAAHDESPLRIPPHEVLFIPTHGKTGMASLARTLHATGVTVVASPDIDVLNNETVLSRLVESLGGDWSSLETLYRRAVAEFKVPRSPRRNRDILTAVESVLGADPLGVYNSETQARITAQLYVESEWRRLKQFGVSAFSADVPSATALVDGLAAHGVVLVQVGELEKFARDVSIRKGPGWLDAALAANAHTTPEALAHVRRFVT